MNCDLSDLPMESLCDVELQIYSENDLYDEHDHQDVREGGVNVLREGSSLMKMSQEICHHRNRCSQDLYGYMKSIASYLLKTISLAPVFLKECTYT